MTQEDEAVAAENARLLFARPATFLRGAPVVAHLPDMEVPEVAFAGRSNVGKSTLINALTGQSGLARASNTPGRTQELNFFDLQGRLRLVDLPGYGYAKAPLEKVERWNEVLRRYLTGRRNLARAFLLVDARRGIGKIDREMMETLAKAATPFQVVITKGDLLKPKQREALVAAAAQALTNQVGAIIEPILTSSEKRDGLDDLRRAIAAFALPDEPA